MEEEEEEEEEVNYDTKSRSVQRLGYKSEPQGNMFRFWTVWNVLTKVDV
jgi:hypothetical protein